MIPEELVTKLQKLNNEIDELKALSITSPQFTVWKSTVERLLKNIFGEKSIQVQQFLEIDYYPSFVSSGTSPLRIREIFVRGLDTAKLQLNSFLDEIKENIPSPTNKTFSSVLKLHPKIIAVSEKLFLDGHYAQAIFESIIVLEQEIKNKSGVTNKIGVNLMNEVFNHISPILKINPGYHKRKKMNDKDLMIFLEAQF